MAQRPALERLPYFKFHCADYLLDTLSFTTAEQHGIYVLLLIHYYWNGELPRDRAEIPGMCKASPGAVDEIIKRFFHEESGRIVHHRVERELLGFDVWLRSQSAKGLRSAEVRAAKKETVNAPKDPPSKANGKRHQKEFPLPDWINRETWEGWIASRPARARSIEAQVAALKKMEKFRAAGHNTNEIIENSIANGWQGLFEPKTIRGNIAPNPSMPICRYCQKEIGAGQTWTMTDSGRMHDSCKAERDKR